MYEFLLFFTGLLGTILAGLEDLKTSEISDKYAIIISLTGIIVHLYLSYIAWDVWPILKSISSGVAFLLFGYLMFYTKQWGEADVLILSSLGFLIPGPLSFFTLSVPYPYYLLYFLATVFLVGGVYSILYGMVLALRTDDFMDKYLSVLSGMKSFFRRISLLFVLFYLSFSFYLYDTYMISIDYLLVQFLFMSGIIITGFIMVVFAKAIDSSVFRKQIDVSELQEGDVLAECPDPEERQSKEVKDFLDVYGGRFVGLEKKDIEYIRKHKDKVWIKEGIRFAPTFFLALLFVWLVGDVFSLLVF